MAAQGGREIRRVGVDGGVQSTVGTGDRCLAAAHRAIVWYSGLGIISIPCATRLV